MKLLNYITIIVDYITNIVNYIIIMDNVLEILQQFDHDNIRIYIINKSKIQKFNNNNYYDLTNDQNYKNIIINKLKNMIDVKTIEYTLKRDYYYSQIRDIDIKRKKEKSYVIEEKQLKIIKLNNIDFIINSFEVYIQDLQSFPNLHKYHYEKNIERIEYIFTNIKLVFENNNIFIDLKKNYDVNDLHKVLTLFTNL